MIIKKHSNQGDTVLDTFLGGGTTAYAAKNLKINETYYTQFIEIYNNAL